MTRQIIGSKGGGGGTTFVTKPDTLRSNDSFEILLGLGSGRWKGLVNGLKSLKINGIPMENADGTSNFDDIYAIFADGNPLEDQLVQFRLGGGGSTQSINTQLSNPNSSGPGPWVAGAVSTPNADFIDMRFVVQQLYYQDEKSIRENTATIEIEMRPSGSATWVNIFSAPVSDTVTYDPEGYGYYDNFSAAMYHLYLGNSLFKPSGTGFRASTNPNLVIRGKTTSSFVKELRVAVPKEGTYADQTWEVRARLVEKDTVDNNTIQQRRLIAFESITAVIKEPLGDHPDWDGQVWLQLYGKASQQFSGFPEIDAICDTKICKTPPTTIFNPDTRQYSGLTWDGSYEEHFTTDPAWNMKEFIEDPIHGLAGLQPGSILDKWDALEASKYYSELVPDGKGGTHPRFSMNVTINEARDVEEMMSFLAGSVNSYTEDVGGGVWRLKVDKPETPVMLFTEDNIFNEFNYSHTDVDTRFNDWRGTFLNEDLDYEVDTVRVHDQDDIDLNGIKFTEIALVGCTNKQEALRRLMFRLRVSLNEYKVVNFATNRIGRYINPLDTILIADGGLNADHLAKSSSRLLTNTGSEITLGRPVRLEIGVNYVMHFATTDQTTITRSVLNAASERGDVVKITLDSALPNNVMPESAVALEAVGLPANPLSYRVLAIERGESSEDEYIITATLIDSGKWNAMDNVSAQELEAQQPSISIDSPTVPDGGMFDLLVYATEFDIKRALQVNWDRPGGQYLDGFQVEYRINDGPWKLLMDVLKDSVIELEDPQDGVYDFRITALDRRGVKSTPLVGRYELVGSREARAPTHLRGTLLDRPGTAPYEGFRYTVTDGPVPVTYVWEGGAWTPETNLITEGSQIGVENGATRNKWRGDYSAGATYIPGDMVRWTVASGGTGHTYQRIDTGDTTGVAPSDLVKWELFIEQIQGNGVEIVTGLPSTGLTDGRVIFNDADQKLYVYKDGVGWKLLFDADTDVAAALANGSLTTAKFASDIQPVGIVTGVPGTLSTNVIYDTTTDKLYRWNGSAYVASVPTTDLTGQITNAQIADVAATKISGTITDAQINSISTAKLTGQITATQITDGAISTPKLAAGSVTTAVLAAGAVTTEKMVITAGNLVANGNFATGNLTNWRQWAGASSQSVVNVSAGGLAQYALLFSYSGESVSSVFAANKAYSDVGANLDGFAVEGGKEYYVSVNALKSAFVGNFRVIAYYWTNTGYGDANTVISVNESGVPTSWGSSKLTGSFTAPANASRCWLYIIVDGWTAGSVWVTNVQATQKAGGELIVDGAITTGKLAATAVTADKIAAGSITTAKLAAGAVTANKLTLVPSGQTINADPGITDPTAWSITGANVDVASAYVGGKAFFSTSTSSEVFSERQPIDPTKVYRASFEAQGVGSNQASYALVAFYDASGNLISGGGSGWPGAGTYHYYGLAGAVPPSSKTKYAITFGPGQATTAPSNAKFVKIGALVTYPSGGSSGYNVFGSFMLQEVMPAELIVDGAISADKLAANSVIAGKIAAGAVSATEIAAGAITTEKLNAGAVTTAKITAGAITATEIASDAITTNKLLAGAVTAAKIAASTITANEIAAGAITTNKIAALAITANEIAAGAITTAKIAASNVTADKISVTTLSAITANLGTITAGYMQSPSGNTQIDLNNARIIFNNGTYMKVTGVGFGSSSQFLEWYGPTQASLSTCTEANAIYYLKTNGEASFKGAVPNATTDTSTKYVDGTSTDATWTDYTQPLKVSTAGGSYRLSSETYAEGMAENISCTSNMKWQYSTNQGGSWTDVSGASFSQLGPGLNQGGGTIQNYSFTPSGFGAGAVVWFKIVGQKGTGSTGVFVSGQASAEGI